MGKRNPKYYQDKATQAVETMRSELADANRMLEKFRKTAETAHADLPYGRLGHSELAGRVFMLSRQDMNHVGLTTAARDRILWLANQVHDLTAENQRLQDQINTYEGTGKPRYVEIPPNAPLNISVSEPGGTVKVEVANNYKLLRNTTHAERSWPHEGENGQYQNLCVHCDRGFLGHKRTPSCRVCHNERSADNNAGMLDGSNQQVIHNARMEKMLTGRLTVEQAFDGCP